MKVDKLRRYFPNVTERLENTRIVPDCQASHMLRGHGHLQQHLHEYAYDWTSGLAEYGLAEDLRLRRCTDVLFRCH